MESAALYQLTEYWQFWVHLQNAGLVPGSYTGIAGPTGSRNALPGVNVMAAKYGSNGGFMALYWPGAYTIPASNMLLLGTPSIGGDGTGYETYNDYLLPADAYNIDSKIDDGIQNMGSVVGSSPIGNCNGYNLTVTAPACSLFMGHRLE